MLFKVHVPSYAWNGEPIPWESHQSLEDFVKKHEEDKYYCNIHIDKNKCVGEDEYYILADYPDGKYTGICIGYAEEYCDEVVNEMDILTSYERQLILMLRSGSAKAWVNNVEKNIIGDNKEELIASIKMKCDMEDKDRFKEILVDFNKHVFKTGEKE